MTGGLSVVIAARNAEETIAQQLQALTRQPWLGGGEIVVADNGSTDSTEAVAHRFDGPAIRVRVVDASDQPGAGHARNVGVAHTRHPSIAFCDADDVVDSTWVSAMCAAIASHDAVGGRLEFDRLNPHWVVGSRGRLLAAEHLPLFDGVFPVLSSCNFGIRRSVFDALGGFDTSFLRGQDAELSLRLHLAGFRVTFAGDAVVHYRMRSSARAIFTQARGWGEAQVGLRRALPGGSDAPRRQTLRSWIWLGSRVPTLGSRSGRARWAHVAGTRVGTASARRRQRVARVEEVRS